MKLTTTGLAIGILGGCVALALLLVGMAAAFVVGRAAPAPAAAAAAPAPSLAVTRSDPRCAALLAGDETVVNSAHATSWASLESGAAMGPVAMPIYVTRAFDPQADGSMEIVAADPNTRASFVMLAPAAGVDARVLRGGHATAVAFGPVARATSAPNAPVLVCGVVPR